MNVYLLEMVNAEPEYAEGPLQNAAEVANRLVIVKRGLVGKKG